MHKFLDKAMDLLLTHEFDHGLKSHHCCLIVRGGNILSVGFNGNKTSSFVEYYTDIVRGSKRTYKISCHAEMAAIQKVRRKTDLTGCTMFVVRRSFLESKDLFALSTPCSICSHIIPRFSIRKVFYSIDNCTYGCMTTNYNSEDNIHRIIHC